jgi:hypothetical protein
MNRLRDYVRKMSNPRRAAWLALLLAFVLAVGCKKPATEESAAGPKTFASPEAAAQTLYDAAKSGNPTAILSIFGPDAKDFLFSGDATQDKESLDAFCSDYDKMHRWGKLQGGSLVLNVGVENYPFPFPLEKDSSGHWYFDSNAAKKEFVARRIGDNELNVIDVLNAMADAQSQYFSTPHDGSKVKQYAQKFFSSEGKHDGLYWKVEEGQPESPLGPLAARASAEGYKGMQDNPQPFHGYYFRILTEQGSHASGGAKNYIANGNMTGGFAFLAWPAEYRVTGVTTFLINQNGEVFQKDLGPQTADLAKAITSFDPDDTWSPVE